MRFRNIFLGVGSALVVFVLLLSDPDGGLVSNLPFGSGVLTTLIILVSSVLYIGLLHLARKALADYLDLEVYFKKALLSPEGSGMALIAVAIMMVSISIVILASVK
jgi:hypothetical protein